MRLSCTLSANHRLIPWLLWIPKIWYVWYWRLSKPSVSFCEDHYVAESWQCWPSAQLLQNSASHAPAWQSWIPISGMKGMGGYTKQHRYKTIFIMPAFFGSDRGNSFWTLPQFHEALDMVQERASKKRILLENTHCSLVLAVFIQGRVLTIRIIYRSACPFHTLSVH